MLFAFGVPLLPFSPDWAILERTSRLAQRREQRGTQWNAS